MMSLSLSLSLPTMSYIYIIHYLSLCHDPGACHGSQWPTCKKLLPTTANCQSLSNTMSLKPGWNTARPGYTFLALVFSILFQYYSTAFEEIAAFNGSTTSTTYPETPPKYRQLPKKWQQQQRAHTQLPKLTKTALWESICSPLPNGKPIARFQV